MTWRNAVWADAKTSVRLWSRTPSSDSCGWCREPVSEMWHDVLRCGGLCSDAFLCLAPMGEGECNIKIVSFIDSLCLVLLTVSHTEEEEEEEEGEEEDIILASVEVN